MRRDESHAGESSAPRGRGHECQRLMSQTMKQCHDSGHARQVQRRLRAAEPRREGYLTSARPISCSRDEIIEGSVSATHCGSLPPPQCDFDRPQIWTAAGSPEQAKPGSFSKQVSAADSTPDIRASRAGDGALHKRPCGSHSGDCGLRQQRRRGSEPAELCLNSQWHSRQSAHLADNECNPDIRTTKRRTPCSQPLCCPRIRHTFSSSDAVRGAWRATRVPSRPQSLGGMDHHR